MCLLLIMYLSQACPWSLIQGMESGAPLWKTGMRPVIEQEMIQYLSMHRAWSHDHKLINVLDIYCGFTQRSIFFIVLHIGWEQCNTQWFLKVLILTYT